MDLGKLSSCDGHVISSHHCNPGYVLNLESGLDGGL